MRILKRGGDLRVYLDDNLALQFHDDKPLNYGHVALWCVRNGFLIARARIFERENAPTPIVPLTRP